MRVLVIPDVHLKGWMFDRAEEIGQKENVRNDQHGKNENH